MRITSEFRFSGIAGSRPLLLRSLPVRGCWLGNTCFQAALPERGLHQLIAPTCLRLSLCPPADATATTGECHRPPRAFCDILPLVPAQGKRSANKLKRVHHMRCHTRGPQSRCCFLNADSLSGVVKPSVFAALRFWTEGGDKSRQALATLLHLLRSCQFKSGKTTRLRRVSTFLATLPKQIPALIITMEVHSRRKTSGNISWCSMTIMLFVVWTAISTALVFAPWPQGTTQKDQDEN
jgi:hypothetical protein